MKSIHPDDPLEDVVTAFRGMPIPDRPPDEVVLVRLERAQEVSKTKTLVFVSTRPIWRFLMLPTIRYATAVAIAFILAGWLVLSPSRTLALAEVIKAAEQHKLVRFQSRQTVDDRQTDRAAAGMRTVYVDLVAPRVREEERHKTFNEILDFRYVAVYDYRLDRFLALVSHEQVLSKEQAKDEFTKQLVGMAEERGLAKKKATLSHIARTRTDNIPPMSLFGKGQGFLDSLRELQANTRTLATRETLDGREVDKFHLKVEDTTASLWVDPRTKLPVRMEIEMINPTQRISRNEWVYTGFEWDPQVPDVESLFSTEPPRGYFLEDHRNQ